MSSWPCGPTRLIESDSFGFQGAFDPTSQRALARASFAQEELFSADIVLLGRKTYDGFAPVWPHVEDEAGFAARLNSMPKYVASRSMPKATWDNTTVIRDDVLGKVGTLKSEGDGDLLVYGSAGLVHDLLPAGLVDFIHLMVYPTVLGRGTRLLPDGWSSRLELDAISELGTGIVSLRYLVGAG